MAARRNVDHAGDMGHPNVLGRKTAPTGEAIRVLVYAQDALAGYIEAEVKRRGAIWQAARTVEQIVAALVLDPPPRAQMLIADFDAMSPMDVMRLHSIREQGWFGVLIAFGSVPDALRSSLNIETVFVPPYKPGALEAVIAGTNVALATTKIPTFR